MKYYQFFAILVLSLALLFGRFLLSPQKVFYGLTNPEGVEFPRVRIYSTYPFNNRSEVTIAAGSRQGVKELMTVAVDGKFLFGQVTKVFDDVSVVRTIFDSRWKIPVRIGSNQVDALLEGGLSPSLTLIAKDKIIKDGDAVYSASRDFPYGLVIGQVKNTKDLPTEVFKTAELTVPYNFNDLREVEIFNK